MTVLDQHNGRIERRLPWRAQGALVARWYTYACTSTRKFSYNLFASYSFSPPDMTLCLFFCQQQELSSPFQRFLTLGCRKGYVHLIEARYQLAYSNVYSWILSLFYWKVADTCASFAVHVRIPIALELLISSKRQEQTRKHVFQRSCLIWRKY